MTDITKAILAINPKAEVVIIDENLTTIQWLNNTQPIPANEIIAKQQELIAEYQSNKYKRNRENEYPNFKEYLDGIVKGDNAQVQKYINDCLAVKAKYPKE
jgi:hypothetical protein